MIYFSYFYRIIRKVFRFSSTKFYNSISYVKLWGNGVKFNSSLVCNGILQVDINRTGICVIGDNCRINSDIGFNPIGRYSPTFLIVHERASLTIGNNTGISSSAIICHKEIRIGDRVKLGGNVAIYDTDFHSLSSTIRNDKSQDFSKAETKSVIIGDDAFIGAHSTILKGVTIGRGAIIGACSVVTKNVPSQEIWAGNPAKFIRMAI